MEIISDPDLLNEFQEDQIKSQHFLIFMEEQRLNE
jgi:hypothetical protein